MEALVVADLLDRLAEPDTTVEEADTILGRLDDARLEAVPWVYQRLHDAQSEADVHAASRVLARWRHDRLSSALAPALRAMIAEQAVGDLNKLAAAALLERMGQPMDDEDLKRSLRDPSAVAGHALATALDASVGAAALVNQLDALGGLPPSGRQPLIDDLVRLGDPRAVRMLGPLALSADGETAISAVAAIDLMRLGEADVFLDIAAEHHPDADVRREARRTALRLATSSDPPRLAPVDGLRVLASAGQPRVLIVSVPVAVPVDGEDVDVLSLIVSDVGGVTEYAVAESVPAVEFDAMVDRFRQGGVDLAPATAPEAASILARAAGLALESGAGERLGHLAWPFLLGAPAGGEPTIEPASDGETDRDRTPGGEASADRLSGARPGP